MMMMKISAGLFLLRLAATNVYRNICIGFVVVMTLYSIASVFTVIFQCIPVNSIWDPTVHGAKCLSPHVRVALSKSYSIICAISDFFLVLLPVSLCYQGHRMVLTTIDCNALECPDLPSQAYCDMQHPWRRHTVAIPFPSLPRLLLLF